jgi:hypothetical protein
MQRPYEYNDYDYGFRTPRPAAADFGARGREFGVGIDGYGGTRGMGFVAAPTSVVSSDPMFATPADQQAAEVATAQMDAANAAAQVVALQAQLDQVQAQADQAVGAVAASLQQQVSDLQAQVAAQKTTAVAAQAKASGLSVALSPYKKYLPMLALGVVAVLALGMLKKK